VEAIDCKTGCLKSLQHQISRGWVPEKLLSGVYILLTRSSLHKTKTQFKLFMMCNSNLNIDGAWVRKYCINHIVRAINKKFTYRLTINNCASLKHFHFSNVTCCVYICCKQKVVIFAHSIHNHPPLTNKNAAATRE
jgi:hypothetical protein